MTTHNPVDEASKLASKIAGMYGSTYSASPASVKDLILEALTAKSQRIAELEREVESLQSKLRVAVEKILSQG